jgi:hypothetical protein
LINRPGAYNALPDGFHLLKSLDLIKDRKMLVLLSLASLGFFVVSWAGLAWLLQVLRPNIAPGSESISFSLTGAASIFVQLLVLLGVIFVMVTLHEAIHGVFFWLFTGGRVKFAFRGAYAYAAAPGWYIRKAPYLFISMAPLVLISLLGVIALLLIPVNWILPVLLLVAMNASGAVGDLYVFFLLVSKSGDMLVQDFGERMEIYARNAENIHN